MRAIITGSFDPITVGHVEIIKKASKLFDELYVVALLNPEKSYMFSLNEKKEIMSLALSELKNVIVDAYDGLTADYMHQHKINKIVRGIRSEADMEYEAKLADAMKEFDENFETIFILSDAEFSHISSTCVRELIKGDKSLLGVVPKEVEKRIIELYKSKK